MEQALVLVLAPFVVLLLAKEWVTLEVVSSFGGGGRYPGYFFGVGSVAVDSKGNVYTGETYEGKRLQKFVNRGLAPVTSANQGVVWPRRSGPPDGAPSQRRPD